MNKLYDSILDTVGNTPIVRLNKLGPDDVNVWVNELRVSGYDEESGIAALLNADIQLADLARVKATIQTQTDHSDCARRVGGQPACPMEPCQCRSPGQS